MREELFSGKIVKLVVVDDHWEIVEHADSVAVLVTDERRVLGVWQQRMAVGERTWEIPAGLIEPGEKPLQAAERELAEEVQLGGTLTALVSFYVSPGFTDEQVFVFELSEARHETAEPDEGEDLKLEWRDALDVWNAVASGAERTSSTTALALRHRLAELGIRP